MSMLRRYFEEAEREYNYRIKTVFELNENVLDEIEKVMQRYNPHGMTEVDKTILHTNPADFPEFKAAEVFSVDVCLGLPVSTHEFRIQLAQALGVSLAEIVVRGEGDPSEAEREREAALEAIEAEADGEQAEALLNTAQDYPEHDSPEAETMYGDKYNNRLLSMMAKISEEKKAEPIKTHEYEDVKNDVEEDDGPQIGDGEEAEHAETSAYGNYDDNRRKYRRVYRNGRLIEKDGIAVKRGG
jgi:hypothetical protein